MTSTAAATKATATKSTGNGKSTAGTSSHAPAHKPATAAAPSSTEDSKLLSYVRSNSQRIVSALSYSASRSGELQNWTEMQETMAIANQLSLLSGLGGVPAKPLAQTAAAGR